MTRDQQRNGYTKLYALKNEIGKHTGKMEIALWKKYDKKKDEIPNPQRNEA